MSADQVDVHLKQATAMLAELEPETATQAMLAVQMVGTHLAAMTFTAKSMERNTPQGHNNEKTPS